MSDDRDQYTKYREEQAALLLAAKRQAASQKYNPLKRGPLAPKNVCESVKKVRIEESEVKKIECEIDKENSFADEREQMAAMLLAAKKNVGKTKKDGFTKGLDVNLVPNKCELEEKKEKTWVESANMGMDLDPKRNDAISLDQNTELLEAKKDIFRNTAVSKGETAKKRDEIRYGFNVRPIRIRLTKEFPQSNIRNRLIEKGKFLLEAKMEILENLVYEEDLDLEVPDTEFHDFDLNRTWQDFQKDQVWAAYDDDDGMPRFYALVQKILSKKRFKIRISYLKGRSTVEFGRMSWIGSGFSKTCGDFRVETKPEIVRSANMFSHRVNFEKNSKDMIRIFPEKGEIWALYKNWSSNWNACTPDEIIHEYEMVQILEEYEKKGIWVVDLEKVSGFRTVFKWAEKNSDKRFVKREEMFRFSHQVPAFALDGGLGLDGCFELDPAALPADSVRVKKEGLD